MLKILGKSQLEDCNLPTNVPKMKINGRNLSWVLASKKPASFSIVKDQGLFPEDQEPGEAIHCIPSTIPFQHHAGGPRQHNQIRKGNQMCLD